MTHTDFDGICCAVMLHAIHGELDVEFREPYDSKAGRFLAEPTDAVTDLPFPAEGCALYYDHHPQAVKVPDSSKYHLDVKQPSCAGYIYRLNKDDHDLSMFKPLIKEVDRIDSGKFSKDNIENPGPVDQISIALLRNPEDFEFMRKIIKMLQSLSIEETASHPEVQRKFREEQNENKRFMEHAEESSRMEGKVLVVDLCRKDELPSGNPFELYLKFPKAEFVLKIRDDPKAEGMVRMGLYKNVWTPKNKVHLGLLAQKHGGGGHKGAAGCGIKLEEKEQVLAEIIKAMNDAV
ncbi:hypothetical protein GOV11_00230 [Candidatus Woesearchaeota archaeon]|nr:hypothetical protein [Candidatus Woesearchaeota archaeon]